MSQNNRNLNNRSSKFLPDANINNLGFVGLAQYQILQDFQLQGGLRFDSYRTETFALGTEGEIGYHAPVKKDFLKFSGSIGTTYSPIEKIFMRSNFAKAYRAPNLSELTSNGIHGNRYEIGNADLSPQNAWEIDLSVHYHGKFLSFDLAGFYNIVDDYIFLSPSSDTTSTGTDIYHFSQTNANIIGGEADVHFHPNTTPWLHLECTYSSVIGKQKNNNYLPYIPVNKIRYEIWIESKKLGFLNKPNIRLSALTAFPKDNPSPFETATDGYTIVYLSASSDIIISMQTIVIGVFVNNLFDTQYFDHLSTLKPLNYFNPGRNISVFLKVPFALNRKEKIKHVITSVL